MRRVFLTKNRKRLKFSCETSRKTPIIVDEVFIEPNNFAYKPILFDLNVRHLNKWSYRKVEQGLKAQNVKLQDLPKVRGFYKWGTSYIATSKDFVSSDGKPITFSCGNGCSTIVPWNNLRLIIDTIGFKPANEAEAKDLFKETLKYLDNITVEGI